MQIMSRTRQAMVVVLGLMFLPVAPGIFAAKADPVAAVVAQASPAVVRIITVRPSSMAGNKPQQGVVGALGIDRTTAFVGSGFFINPSGFIVTARHVVEGATSVFIETADGVRHRASIVGMTLKADMALLKIVADHALPFLPFGDSDKVRIGDSVIAIGSPFGFDSSVTAGIISAVNRDIMESPFDDYFQTDVATNQGNSGGPLLNMAGEVIGMNSVIFTPDHGWVGLSFALPSNDLRFVFDRLRTTGKVAAGMLPIFTQQVSWMLQQAMGTRDGKVRW
jgi:serine protease Do